jgi:aspartyl-tRNA(Asn)/glutamyl-tRNA(Gln) amidotransferase subunit A
MTDSPWQGDACSLVDEYRAGRRHPKEEMQATLNAIKASGLNSESFIELQQPIRLCLLAEFHLASKNLTP